MPVDSRTHCDHPSSTGGLTCQCWIHELHHSYRLCQLQYAQTHDGQLAKLPNLKHLCLADRYPYLEVIDQRGECYDITVNETSGIVDSLGDMTGLESLDIEFDCTVDGSHLSILQNMKCLHTVCA
jgi:hypothetical protein